MADFKAILPKPEHPSLANSTVGRSQYRTPEEHRQWMLMTIALGLLLVALAAVIWHDRDFWFPDNESDNEVATDSAPASRAPAKAATNPPITHAAKAKHQVASSAPSAPAAPAAAPPAAATTTRTVLPPLEVEVVAGDNHRTVRPGSSSVQVDLQPGMPARPVTEPSYTANADTTASVTSDAAERVQMSSDASNVVTHSVRPSYPLLARQMKVQGSVILQALIGKDGIIQNLRVVSGPHILASAAEDAVRQWHFKPHYEGNEAVETQAKITVNFTISTN
jgi:TonB family protein